MSEDISKALYPWVRTVDFGNYVNKQISFVGKVKGTDAKSIILTDFKGNST